MEETKKVKRKRFNFLKFLIVILFLYLLVCVVIYSIKVPIKNIVILNNNYVSDEEIIETAKIQKYPSFFRTFSSIMSKRIEKITLIKDAKIRKKFNFTVEIDITEYKILYKNRSDNKYILDDGSSIELEKDIKGVPVLINYVPDEILEKLKREFTLLSINTISKISEIEYTPTTYDSERFILYMNDTNSVYITLNKTESLDKYTEIVTTLEGHSGILYLDSGNFFEIKD